MFGTAGLPHILMRFYTVPDAEAARKSVFYATGLIGFFYLMTFVGFGAMVLVGRDVDQRHRQGRQHGGAAARRDCWAARRSSASSPRWRSRPSSRWWPGSRCPAPRRCRTTSGSTWCARPGDRARAAAGGARSRPSSSACSPCCSASLFKGQNVAFMVGLAFAIAGSANFPALLLSIFWRRFTTAGAVAVDPHRRLPGGRPDRPQPDGLGGHLCTTRRRSSRSRTRPSSR